MTLPDIEALREGDPDAWETLFRWLWPAIYAVAELKLQPFLPGEIEDVAIETLEALVEKVSTVPSVEQLKPLAASIAHHRAVSRLRERFAAKRGTALTQSFESLPSTLTEQIEMTDDGPLAALEEKELAALLAALQAELQPGLRAILSDFFTEGLSYAEIAAKHGLALGTVGVYLKRGLELLRRQRAQHPYLLKELEGLLR